MNSEQGEALVMEMVEKWKTQPQCKHVEGTFLSHPSEEQLARKCPEGCELESRFAKNGEPGWRVLEEEKLGDFYRKDLLCRKHGYAYIYLTTGLAAIGSDFELTAN